MIFVQVLRVSVAIILVVGEAAGQGVRENAIVERDRVGTALLIAFADQF